MTVSLKFSGHQSFSFRNTWLTKGIQNLSIESNLFKRNDALVTLGVGKNMVTSIKYWCLAFQLIQSVREKHKYQDKITDYGQKLFLDNSDEPWDIYLEDIGTLWLLHFLYTTNEQYAGTAFYVFNEFPSIEFSRNSLNHQLELWVNKNGSRISPNTIKRDLNTFIHTYAGSSYRKINENDIEDSLACPLTDLRLISHLPEEDTFLLKREPRTNLPDDIFLFSVAKFIKQVDQSTISFNDLSYAPLSPGRIFRLDEFSLTERLEKLENLTSGKWILTETAGMRQILIRQPIPPMMFLERYYQSSGQG